MTNEKEPKAQVPRVRSAAYEATLIKPGEVRNPNGRPKKVWTAEELQAKQAKTDLRAAAKEFSAEALNTIVSIMRNENAPFAVRLSASSTILDRGHGRVNHNLTVDNKNQFNRMSDIELLKLIYGGAVPDSELEKIGRKRAELHDDYIDVTPLDDDPDAFE